MCSGCRKFKSTSWLFALLLLLGTGQGLYAHVDPPGCNATGVTVTMSVFACTAPGTCNILLGLGDTVVAGERIAYQSTVTYPGGAVCGFTGGSLTITPPGGAATSVITGGTSSPAGVATLANACFGCTAPPVGQTAVTSWTSPKLEYVVSAANFTPAGCTPGTDCLITAPTAYVGGVQHASAGDITGQPTGGTSSSLSAVACSATIDKQVSCDGKAIGDVTKVWYDQTGADDTGGLIKGCTAKLGDNVDIRFIAKNTGGAAISCTLTDNVTTINALIPAGGAVSLPQTLNATSTVSLNPFACTLTGSDSGTNTGTLGSCTCQPPQEVPTVTGTGGSDTATYACCGVSVDKQVSCTNGVPAGAQDVGFVTADQDGPLGCSTQNGQNVSATYQVKNTGNVPLTCTGGTLGVVDTFVVNSQSTFTGSPAQVGTIAAGGTVGPFTDPVITQCTSELNTNESQGDKLTANCECGTSADPANDVLVSAFDVAQIQCSAVPPNFTITKTCVPVAGVAGSFTADVKVTNTGTNSISCALVDQVVTGTCSATTCPVANGTPVTVSSNPLVVAASSVGDATGTITGLASTSCNQACGTCSPSGLTCTTAADCPDGLPAGTVTKACTTGQCTYATVNAATAECPVGSCFERTPGYWGTHPQVTSTLLPLTVCGQLLTATNAGVPQSATENLCESGGDFKITGAKGKDSAYTSPQQLQLIRQCTAAALNLAASGLSGGLPAGIAACDGAVPGIANTFAACCGGQNSVGGACTTAADCPARVGTNKACSAGVCTYTGNGGTCNAGATSTVIDASNCITLIDAFNNIDGGDFSQVGLTNSPAQPAQCKAANGNGVTNCSSDPNTPNVGGTIHCGTK